KGAGLWNSLVNFCIESGKHSSKGVKELKGAFTQEEKAADKDHKVKMGENSTYRVCKSVLTKAAALDISLVDADGKVKGKTAVEQEIAAHAEEKSNYEKFKSSMNTATVLAAKVVEDGDVSEVGGALLLVQELWAELEMQHTALKAAAAAAA
ncbi:MAG TPA: hypothetical protein V6D20_04805, partial [Candidatus Obscuribacterales bacterium]